VSGTPAPRYRLTIERYMTGVQEEKGCGRIRFFGDFLLGITRFAPALDSLGSDVRFTGLVSLGIKGHLTRHVALRAESRAFYIVTQAGGAALCSGGCVFVYAGNGTWQGDVSAAAVLRF